MTALIEVILPVFLVIGLGYVAVWRKMIDAGGIEGLMIFSQKFAIPMLLFTAMTRLDLGASFDPRLLVSFYTGAVSGFALGMIGARLLFKRSWEDSVAIGFLGLFSNSLLLGVPITERAYGTDALAANFTIIAVHSPICYGIGITAMEIVRAERGARLPATVGKILKAMFSNGLVVGITLGILVNLSGLPLPGVLTDAIDMMVRAALPAALFGLGGVLFFYRPEGDLRVIGMAVTISLLIHPLITWSLGKTLGLTTGQFRSAVLTAAMAPGVNSYLFANMYDAAKRVAASAVLIGTALSILTVWMWLAVLP